MSKKKKCVVIAGSYYETNYKNKLFRNNVSTIFLPSHPAILIAKRHTFSHEQQAMVTSIKLPNIARLIWSVESRKNYSINIYLCRDYLIPYRTTNNRNRVSQLDWENPGLNIVVMCSSDTSLFKGLAALDVRRMRGMGKFVALCNCSNVTADAASDEGSMLLGPTEVSQRERDDIISMLPGDVEGIILAEMDVDKVALIEEKPDKHIHDPLKHISKYAIGWDKDYSKVHIKPTYKPLIRERGVWHPAFLELMHRNILIELLSTNLFYDAINVFQSDDVCWVTVAALRGIHDIMIRCYVHTEWDQSALCMPYCKLNETEINKLSEKDMKTTLIVNPRKIYKYRTVPIPEYSTEEWETKKYQIQMKLTSAKDKRKQLLTCISCLASDWNATDVSDAERKEVADIFFELPETTPGIAKAKDRCLRRTYILVMILSSEKSKWDLFLKDIVKDFLMNKQEVRSIYAVDTIEGSPDWHYWLDIVADPFRTDEILIGLHKMCKDREIPLATRSMDVIEQLKGESVDGIERSEWGEEVKDFIVGLKRIEEPSVFSKLDLDMISNRLDITRACATAYAEQINLPFSSVNQDVRMKVGNFYDYLVLGNFAISEDLVIKYLEKASEAWRGIYRLLETKVKTFLETRFGKDYRKELEQHFKAIGKEDRIHHILKNEIRALFEFFTTQKSESNFQDPNVRSLRKQMEPVYSLRDRLTHESTSISELNVREVTVDHGVKIVNQISTYLRTLIETLNCVQQNLDKFLKMG